MNKSLKFLAISLLMVPALVKAADDTQNSKLSQVMGWVYWTGTQLKEAATGATVGFGSGLGFRGLEALTGLTEKTKMAQGYTRADELKLIVAAGGTVCVAKQVNSWLGANSDEIGAFGVMSRTAGNFAGIYAANRLFPSGK